MKRSELEKKIIYWFADTIGLDLFDHHAADLLRMLEEAGMSPPKYNKEYITTVRRIGPGRPLKDSINIVRVNEWEPEE